jgi:citrate synthase
MPEFAELHLPGKIVKLPVVIGSENEPAVDVSKLRDETGFITLDSGYGNTGSTYSAITYIDGEKGILRYRGYPIEQLAEQSTFVETAYLLIWGELPTRQQREHFRELLTQNAMLHEGLRHSFEGFPPNAPPMAILSAMINAMSCYHPETYADAGAESFMVTVAKLVSKVRTIAAFSYKKSIGQPVTYPNPVLDYCSNFLHMMFSVPYDEHIPDPDVVRALNQILILHADHEQNCSTSTVRMVGSSKANLFASVSAGVCALWGPLHGGANIEVLDMLEEIRSSGISVADHVARVKDKKAGARLMGFGHRVYKNFDPRAKILKASADKVLAKLGKQDPLLDIARQLEEVALKDSYFIERKLYPNVDFYSGIIMRAMGIPVNLFTVMFAIGRMPGWIANWYEIHSDPKARIYRPRQVYTGPTTRAYVPIDQRG